jgi:putative transposase
MTLTLNYTYRIYPSQAQEVLLNEWLETCRVSYNYALRELKDWLASRKCPIDRCSLDKEYIMSASYPFPGYHAQQNALPKAKQEFPRLAEVPSQVLQTNIRRLHDSWDAFRERGYGFPRFKKFGQMKSLLFPQFRVSPVGDNCLKLPKLKEVVTNFHRPLPDGFIVKQIRVLKKAIGWFAIVSIESDVSIPEIAPYGRAVGVDIGLIAYVATSDGFTLPRPKFFVALQSKLKLLQRRLARKNKRSRNYEKARLKVERLHNHIAFLRKDWQFKLAHQLCGMGDSIFVEDIDFRISAKGFLGKHMLDGGFGQFRSILKWVCFTRGKFFGTVDHRGTSKECPDCGTEWRNDLSIRWHTCTECGTSKNRDVASGEVIRNRGTEKYPWTIGEWKPSADCGLPGRNPGKCNAEMPKSDLGKPALYS